MQKTKLHYNHGCYLMLPEKALYSPHSLHHLTPNTASENSRTKQALERATKYISVL